MRGRNLAQNLYKSILAEPMESMGSGGLPQDLYTIVVQNPPKYDRGWVFVDFLDTAKRDLIYYHGKSGNTLYYYRKNRDLLGNGSGNTLHDYGTSVQENDVSEWVNYIVKNFEDFGTVDMPASTLLSLNVYGGNVNLGGKNVVINDTELTLIPNKTVEVIFNIAQEAFQVVETSALSSILCYHIGTVTTNDTTITLYTDKRYSYIGTPVFKSLFVGPVYNTLAEIQAIENATTGMNGYYSLQENVYYDYYAGEGWVARPKGGTGYVVPNATETQQGVVEKATFAEQESGTSIGGTGASLFSTPDYVKTKFENEGSVLSNSDYIAGEAIVKGDSLFAETGPTFAEAVNAQNIGDIAGNTRVSVRQIGSGVAGSTLKLSLAKVLSPSVNLNIRLETDNAGVPSGTLIDANATATIAPGSLTTSLADTTLTLAGAITIPKGTPYHIVVFVGTYGSETVNATNYYKIGYSIKDTNTRYKGIYNGTSRLLGSLGADVTDQVTASSTFSSISTHTVLFTPKTKVYLKTVSHGLSNCTLTGGGYNLSPIKSGVFTFNVNLLQGVQYTLTFSGGSTNTYTSGSATSTNVTFDSYLIPENQKCPFSLITNVVTGYESCYVNSTLSETNLLSKTSANYIYKLPDIPRIAKDDYTIGELVKYDFDGISKALTGLTSGSTYYISNTPGAISTTPGANLCVIGMAKASNMIDLSKKQQNTVSLANNTVYYAYRNITIYCFAYLAGGAPNSGDVSIVADINSNPTTFYGGCDLTAGYSPNKCAITAIIEKGKYFKVSVNGGIGGYGIYLFD